MKRFILTGITMLGLVMAVNAQFTLIPKLGGSATTVALSSDVQDLDPYYDYGYKVGGIIIGAGAEFLIGGEKFFLQPELLFHQKGWKETGNTFGDEEYTYTLNYLELPVLFKFKFGKFYVNAGPSFSYGIGGKYKGSYSYQGYSQDYDGKIKFGDAPAGYEGEDYYIDNSFDVGVQLGGGVKLGPVILDLRYGMGLSNLMDEYDGFSGDWKNQNRSFQLTVGYPIVIGK